MGRPSDKHDTTGLNAQQIARRSDDIRESVLKYLLTVDHVTIEDIANHAQTTITHIRNHMKVLMAAGCITKHGHGRGTTYTTTRIPYRPVRKSAAHKFYAEQEASQQPGIRIIKLLDRRPHEISKEEHEASRRRYLRSAITGSSMGMFDSY